MSIFMNVADRRLDNNVINKTIRRIAKQKNTFLMQQAIHTDLQKSIRIVFQSDSLSLQVKIWSAVCGLMSPNERLHSQNTLFNRQARQNNTICTFNKKPNLQILSLQKEVKESFSGTVHTKYRHKQTSKNNSYHQLSIKRPTLFQIMIVSRETKDQAKRD